MRMIPSTHCGICLHKKDENNTNGCTVVYKTVEGGVQCNCPWDFKKGKPSRMNDLTGLAAYHDGSFERREVALPERTKICAFCHHSELYHNKEADPSPQMPCSYKDWDALYEEDVQCLCYGFCETKEEAEAISSEPIIGPISGYEVYLMAQEKRDPNHQQIDKVADEIYAILEANSHFMNEREVRILALKCNTMWNSLFSDKLPGFTKAEQSPSYSESAQSEQQPQYEERQASFRSQCKAQHARIVVNQLARMANTSILDRPEELAKATEQLSRLWLALYLCEAIECRAFHKLVAQAQSSLLPALKNSLRTHKGPPNSV